MKRLLQTLVDESKKIKLYSNRSARMVNNVSCILIVPASWEETSWVIIGVHHGIWLHKVVASYSSLHGFDA